MYDFLNQLEFKDGIYSYIFYNFEQVQEIKMREEVASKSYNNYLKEVSQHHSIPVMDEEIKKFLIKIPRDGLILDLGGCWGWHWRNLNKQRPDVKVIIVDMVKNNLVHAQNILQHLLMKQVFLVHGEATDLRFPDQSFNGYWSVQALQHIPNFQQAIKEAYRLLKPEGQFASYSLNFSRPIKWIRTLVGKKYHIKGYIDNNYYLERASEQQEKIINRIFCKKATRRYSEIIFNPWLSTIYYGEKNILGKIDHYLSNSYCFKSMARQCSFHVQKL